jgi:hypothetical protein
MSAPRSRHPRTTHYRHDGVVITDRFFDNGFERFDISALSNLTRWQSPLHRGVSIGITIAAAELVVIVPMLIALRSFVAVAVALPALLIPCLISVICARRWPVRQELSAWYRGREVTLFISTDEHRFGQVARALIRVLENAESYGAASPPSMGMLPQPR